MTDNNEKNINNPHELMLHADNHFEFKNMMCHDCCSLKIIKQEYYPRHLKLAEFGSQTVYVKRYKSKLCNKKFTTQLDAIVEKGHQYTKNYQKHALDSYKTGYCSFIHLNKCSITFLIIHPLIKLVTNGLIKLYKNH
ncbi:MAG: hypothetical protein P1P80_00435 [ANME-2 cluster archaeon]|nr:hypothetical protein [ANME-2 cluster archaeon]